MTVAFDIEIEKESNTAYTEDMSTAYMHNIGRPMIPGDHTCNNEIRNEVYNEEQNEILKMNVANTAHREANENHYIEENDKIHNRDMSQEAPMMPVYTPIVDEHHGVMFVNSSLSLQREQYEHIYSDQDGNTNDKHYMLDAVNDAETFQYAEKIQDKNIPMVEATYFTMEKVQKVLFDGEMYAVITYHEGGHLKAIYKNELEIPTAIDNGANVNVLPVRA